MYIHLFFTVPNKNDVFLFWKPHVASWFRRRKPSPCTILSQTSCRNPSWVPTDLSQSLRQSSLKPHQGGYKVIFLGNFAGNLGLAANLISRTMMFFISPSFLVPYHFGSKCASVKGCFVILISMSRGVGALKNQTTSMILRCPAPLK